MNRLDIQTIRIGTKSSETSSSRIQPRSHRPLQPHTLIFGFLCILYFVPLWLVSIEWFTEGGVLSVGSDAHRVIGLILLIYLLGFSFFCFGSYSVPKLCRLLGAKSGKVNSVAKIQIHASDPILATILIGSFLLSKILLIPEGVYTKYIFDTGEAGSAVWTASMFLSDAMVLLSLIALFSERRRNVLIFFVISAINGVNLLHGTRNFFVIAVLVITVYAYIRTRTSLTKLATYSAAGFVVAVVLAYAVFLIRSHVIDASFSPLNILSPIMFESVFSQMPLVSLLNHPILFSSLGNPLQFLQDVVIFTTPRFLLPDKEAALWIPQFAFLSPLGALNGFAAGLLYFGLLFPIFYYFLGLTAGFLYRWASNQYGAILYVYFTCDLLYRFTRDGYIIPAKTFINTIGIILLLILVRRAFENARSFDRIWHTLRAIGHQVGYRE